MPHEEVKTPVQQKLMGSLKKRYGDKRGEEIYYKMENMRAKAPQIKAIGRKSKTHGTEKEKKG